MTAKKTKTVVAVSLVAATGILAASIYLGRDYLVETWHLYRRR